MPAAAAGGERVTEMISRDVFRESVRKQTFPRRAGVPTMGTMRRVSSSLATSATKRRLPLAWSARHVNCGGDWTGTPTSVGGGGSGTSTGGGVTSGTNGTGGDWTGTSAQGAQKKHRPGEAERAWAQFEAFGGADAAAALVPTGADECAAAVVAREGVAHVRNVLSPTTAAELRAFVLAERDASEARAATDPREGAESFSRVLSPKDGWFVSKLVSWFVVS